MKRSLMILALILLAGVGLTLSVHNDPAAESVLQGSDPIAAATDPQVGKTARSMVELLYFPTHADVLETHTNGSCTITLQCPNSCPSISCTDPGGNCSSNPSFPGSIRCGSTTRTCQSNCSGCTAACFLVPSIRCSGQSSCDTDIHRICCDGNCQPCPF